MISLRQSEPSDAELLLQVWRDAVDDSHDFLSAEDRRAIDPLVADYVATASLLVAMVDGVPAAFMGVTGRNIDSLFIDPRAQGCGIGQMMIEQVGRPATVDVNEQNARAVAFYQHMGFEVVGRSETDGEGRPYPLLHLRRD
jgi:putative acetyltransferase